MDHVWAANAVGTPPTMPGTLQAGYPTDTATPTIPGAYWFYQITEEIRNVIVSAPAGSNTPSASVVNQLATAINVLINGVTYNPTFINQNSGPAAIGIVATLERIPFGGAAQNGMAGELMFTMQDAGGNLINTNAIRSQWTDVTVGNRKSSLIFSSGSGNSLTDSMILDSTGKLNVTGAITSAYDTYSRLTITPALGGVSSDTVISQSTSSPRDGANLRINVSGMGANASPLLKLSINDATYASLSTTGLSVTGAVTSSGGITNTAASGNQLISTTTGAVTTSLWAGGASGVLTNSGSMQIGDLSYSAWATFTPTLLTVPNLTVGGASAAPAINLKAGPSNNSGVNFYTNGVLTADFINAPGSGGMFYDVSSVGQAHITRVNNIVVTTTSNTGLAVTGTISNSSQITTARSLEVQGGPVVFNSTGGMSLYSDGAGGGIIKTYANTSGTSGTSIQLVVGNSTIANATTTGLSVTGILSSSGNFTAGAGTGAVTIAANGGATGTGAGGGVYAMNGGATTIAIGGKSSLFGGAYDNTPSIYGAGTINVNVGMNITGALSVSSNIAGRNGSNGQVIGATNGVDTDFGVFLATGNLQFTNTGASSKISHILGGNTITQISSSGLSVTGTTTTTNATAGNTALKVNGMKGYALIDNVGSGNHYFSAWTGQYFNIGSTDTNVLAINSAGLSLTGTLSSSGMITSTGAESFRASAISPYYSFFNQANSVRYGYLQHDGSNFILSNEHTGGQMNFLTVGGASTVINTSGISTSGSLSSATGINNTAAASTNSVLTLSGSGAYSSNLILGSGGAGGASITTPSYFITQIGATAITTVNSSGMSVNGALSSSGNIYSSGNIGLASGAFQWNQAGVRSWGASAAGGNLIFASGDSLGTFSFNSGVLSNTSFTATRTGGPGFIANGVTTSISTADFQATRTGSTEYSGAGAGANLQLTNSTNNTNVLLQQYSNNFQIFNFAGSTWTQRLLLDTAGSLSVTGAITSGTTITVGTDLNVANGRIFASNGSAAAPAIAFQSDIGRDTGFYWGSDGVIGFTCNALTVGTFSYGGDLSVVRHVNAGGNVVASGYGAFGSYASIGGASTTVYADATNAAIRSTASGGGIYLQNLGGAVTFAIANSSGLTVTGAVTATSTISATGAVSGASASFTGSLAAYAVSTGAIYGTSLNIAGKGASADPYGVAAVTCPNDTNNYSYYGLTRAGQIGAGFGITGAVATLGLAANSFAFGAASSEGSTGFISTPWIAFNSASFNTAASITAGGTIFASSATEGQVGASLTGYNSVYLYNNTTGWGVYSATGGSAFTYARSSGLFSFNGNAATVTTNYSNNTNASYQVLWGNGSNGVYGTGNLTLNPSTGTLTSGTHLVANANLYGSRVILGNGSPTNPSLSFSSDGGVDTGFYWAVDGYISIASNGVGVGSFGPGGSLSMNSTVTAPTFSGNLTGNVTGNVSGSAGSVAYSGLTGTPITWNQNTTGNAATATQANGVSWSNNNASVGWFTVGFGKGSTDHTVYGATNVVINPSGYGAIGFSGSNWTIGGDATYGLSTPSGLNAVSGLWVNGSVVITHDTIGSQSVNYANSAGSAPANGGTSAACSGTAAYATNAGHASTADSLTGGIPWSSVSGTPVLSRFVGSYNTGYLGDGTNGARSFTIPVTSIGVGTLLPLVTVDYAYIVYYSFVAYSYYIGSIERYTDASNIKYIRITMQINGGGQTWPYDFTFNFYI